MLPFKLRQRSLIAAAVAAAPFFANGINLYFNQADYDARVTSDKTLVTQAVATSLGLVDTGSINGTYFDSSGVMRVKTSGNGLRLNYVGSQLDALLCEPAATNLCPYSTAIGGMGWGGDATVGTGATAPDGATSLSTLLWSGNADSREYDVLQATTSGATYTISVWAKSTSGTQKFRLGYYGNVTGALHYTADFTATTTLQRFSAQMTLGAGETGVYPAIAVGSAGGVNTGNPLQAWGIQFELGSEATSTILCTGASTVTRTQANFGFAYAMGSSGGTFLLGYNTTKTSAPGYQNSIYFTGAGGVPYSTSFYYYPAGGLAAFKVNSNSVSIYEPSTPISVGGTPVLAAGTVSSSQGQYSANGSAADVTSGNKLPGQALTSIVMVGSLLPIRRIAFSPTVATNAQLAQLSAGTL